jgi:hypothetical protein
MDARTERRIDSLYRNIKSFHFLMVVSIFVPVMLLFVVPLSLTYLYLRRKLLSDIEAGRVALAPLVEARMAQSGGELLIDKIDFIGSHDTRLWVPVFVSAAIAAFVTTLVVLS